MQLTRYRRHAISSALVLAFGWGNAAYADTPPPIDLLMTSDIKYASNLTGPCGSGNNATDNQCRSDAQALSNGFVYALRNYVEDNGANLNGVIIDGDLTANGTAQQLQFLQDNWLAAGLLPTANVWLGLGDQDYASCTDNGCTQRMTDFMREQIQALQHGDLTQGIDAHFSSYDPGSLAYSIDYGKVHLIQLQNYATFTKGDITSSLDWLEGDLKKAWAAGQVILLSVHDSSEHFTDGMTTSQAQSAIQRYHDMLQKYQVAAVFAGHQDNAVGQLSFGIDDQLYGDIPKYQVGSVLQGTGMLVNLRQDSDGSIKMSLRKFKVVNGAYDDSTVLEEDLPLQRMPANRLPNTVDLFQSDDQLNTPACKLSLEPGFNYDAAMGDANLPCQSGEVSVARLNNAVAGTQWVAYGETADHRTEVRVKKDLAAPVWIGNEPIENDYVSVTVAGHGGLDGKSTRFVMNAPSDADHFPNDLVLYAGTGLQAGRVCSFPIDKTSAAFWSNFSSDGSGFGGCPSGTVQTAALRHAKAGESITLLDAANTNWGKSRSEIVANGNISQPVVFQDLNHNQTQGNTQVIFNAAGGESTLTGANSINFDNTAATKPNPGVSEKDLQLFNGKGASGNPTVGMWLVNQRYMDADYTNTYSGIGENWNNPQSALVKRGKAGQHIVFYKGGHRDKTKPYTEVYLKQDVNSPLTLGDLDVSLENAQILQTNHGGALGSIVDIETWRDDLEPQQPSSDYHEDLELFRGTGATGTAACGISLIGDQAFNLAGSDCASVSASNKSVAINTAYAGERLRFYDYPNFNTGKQYVDVDIKQDITSRITINDLSQATDNAQYSVTPVNGTFAGTDSLQVFRSPDRDASKVNPTQQPIWFGATDNQSCGYNFDTVPYSTALDGVHSACNQNRVNSLKVNQAPLGSKIVLYASPDRDPAKGYTEITFDKGSASNVEFSDFNSNMSYSWGSLRHTGPAISRVNGFSLPSMPAPATADLDQFRGTDTSKVLCSITSSVDGAWNYADIGSPCQTGVSSAARFNKAKAGELALFYGNDNFDYGGKLTAVYFKQPVSSSAPQTLNNLGTQVDNDKLNILTWFGGPVTTKSMEIYQGVPAGSMDMTLSSGYFPTPLCGFNLLGQNSFNKDFADHSSMSCPNDWINSVTINNAAVGDKLVFTNAAGKTSQLEFKQDVYSPLTLNNLASQTETAQYKLSGNAGSSFGYVHGAQYIYGQNREMTQQGLEYTVDFRAKNTGGANSTLPSLCSYHNNPIAYKALSFDGISSACQPNTVGNISPYLRLPTNITPKDTLFIAYASPNRDPSKGVVVGRVLPPIAGSWSPDWNMDGDDGILGDGAVLLTHYGPKFTYANSMEVLDPSLGKEVLLYDNGHYFPSAPICGVSNDGHSGNFDFDTAGAPCATNRAVSAVINTAVAGEKVTFYSNGKYRGNTVDVTFKRNSSRYRLEDMTRDYEDDDVKVVHHGWVSGNNINAVAITKPTDDLVLYNGTDSNSQAMCSFSLVNGFAADAFTNGSPCPNNSIDTAAVNHASAGDQVNFYGWGVNKNNGHWATVTFAQPVSRRIVLNLGQASVDSNTGVLVQVSGDGLGGLDSLAVGKNQAAYGDKDVQLFSSSAPYPQAPVCGMSNNGHSGNFDFDQSGAPCAAHAGKTALISNAVAGEKVTFFSGGSYGGKTVDVTFKRAMANYQPDLTRDAEDDNVKVVHHNWTAGTEINSVTITKPTDDLVLYNSTDTTGQAVCSLTLGDAFASNLSNATPCPNNSINSAVANHASAGDQVNFYGWGTDKSHGHWATVTFANALNSRVALNLNQNSSNASTGVITDVSGDGLGGLDSLALVKNQYGYVNSDVALFDYRNGHGYPAQPFCALSNDGHGGNFDFGQPGAPCAVNAVGGVPIIHNAIAGEKVSFYSSTHYLGQVVDVIFKRAMSSFAPPLMTNDYEDENVKVVHHNWQAGLAINSVAITKPTDDLVLYNGTNTNAQAVCSFSLQSAFNSGLFSAGSPCPNNSIESAVVNRMPVKTKVAFYGWGDSKSNGHWAELSGYNNPITTARGINLNNGFIDHSTDNALVVSGDTLSGLDALQVFKGNDVQPAEVVEFYGSSDLKCQGDLLGGRDYSYNLKNNALPYGNGWSSCPNDTIRNIKVLAGRSGTSIKVYDSPDGSTSDDWAEVTLTQDVTHEQWIDMNAMRNGVNNLPNGVVYNLHYKNNLVGKVSHISADVPNH